MRGFAVYILAALVTVLALDFAVPSLGLGLISSGAARGSTIRLQTQWVDRTHKADRLDLAKTTVGRRETPPPRPRLLRGCEPAFSPLTASARADNFSRRCVA
jgi:hypothetical protein